MRFHDLCRACASLLLILGVHPRVVMETFGHSQISLTTNTYSHVLPMLQREAADKMEAVLDPTVKATQVFRPLWAFAARADGVPGWTTMCPGRCRRR